MIYKTGNLFDTDAKYIGHGCNVSGSMSGGIALQFAQKYPEMERQYKKVCDKHGSRLLGSYFLYRKGLGAIVFNLFTQRLPGPYATLGDLESSAYECALAVIKERPVLGEKIIAIPRIGCGIGGLHWDNVEPVLQDIERKTGIEWEVWSL